MTSPLENLTGPGKPLRQEPPDAKEFSGLKQSALARLADSAKTSNSLESRFDLAYNAAHALFAWPPCAGTGFGRPIVTSCFKYCLTLSIWALTSGVCSTNVIPSAISANTKGISTSTTVLSPI
jgi:hypothetical protein